MNKSNDYKNFDSLKLYAKKDKADEIIYNYKVFGWQLENNEENSRYEDIVDLTFYRPHKIANKDELQLLQVYMEDKLNSIAKLARNKFSLTISTALCLGVFSIVILTLGVLACFNVLPFLNLIGGILISTFGFILGVLAIILSPKIFKKEKEKFNLKYQTLQTELNTLHESVKTITGEKYE